jgi:hypothetical protein
MVVVAGGQSRVRTFPGKAEALTKVGPFKSLVCSAKKTAPRKGTQLKLRPFFFVCLKTLNDTLSPLSPP